jgi:hypothetical protein
MAAFIMHHNIIPHVDQPAMSDSLRSLSDRMRPLNAVSFSIPLNGLHRCHRAEVPCFQFNETCQRPRNDLQWPCSGFRALGCRASGAQRDECTSAARARSGGAAETRHSEAQVPTLRPHPILGTVCAQLGRAACARQRNRQGTLTDTKDQVQPQLGSCAMRAIASLACVWRGCCR